MYQLHQTVTLTRQATNSEAIAHFLTQVPRRNYVLNAFKRFLLKVSFLPAESFPCNDQLSFALLTSILTYYLSKETSTVLFKSIL